MAYTDSYFLSTQQDFLGRVTIALLTAAIAVMAEDNTTTNHALRVTYAKKVLDDPDTYVRNAAKAVVTNVAISASFDKDNTHYTTTATDNDIQFTVNSMFDALSGVSK